MADVDIIMMCQDFLGAIGVKNIVLEINSLGSDESRKKFEDSLRDYLTGYRNNLSDDSKLRLEKNILRILDSKDGGDKKILENAPKIGSYYTREDKTFFFSILEKLSVLGFNYKINESLVRGLDYYTSTVFEFTSNSIGAQSTVMAGGRYDRLVEQMGGRAIAAVGCAAGVERLMLLLADNFKEVRPTSLIPVSDNELDYCLGLLREMRAAGIVCELNPDGPMKNKMNLANKNYSRQVIIVGEEELGSGLLTVRDMDSAVEEKITSSAPFLTN
jgi:histidyl-tRNA synthetase